MHVGSAVALAAAVYMINEQLDLQSDNDNAAGFQEVLKIGFIAILPLSLYFLGHFIEGFIAGSESPLPKIKFMHVGSFFALVIAVFMVTAQLIAKNYESSGFVLFTIEVRRFMSFSLQVDLKIWLPLFVATLLFLHGQFRECPGGDKLITLDYYTVFPFNVFSSDPKESDLMVLRLNTCKAKCLESAKQLNITTKKLIVKLILNELKSAKLKIEVERSNQFILKKEALILRLETRLEKEILKKEEDAATTIQSGARMRRAKLEVER
jgi:hypothetical protein